MLKQVVSKNFDAEPCYFKNELHLAEHSIQALACDGKIK